MVVVPVQDLPETDETHPIQNENADTLTLPYPVVGIGASAGGVEAYIDLLRNLPADTGMAFVLVAHLAPHHESHLVPILQKHTQLPVQAIEDGAKPLPDHIYIIKPNALVSIHNGTLSSEPRDSKPKGTLAIDYFFCSLALDQKNMAVGVVLSGMDSDGASGLKAIKGEGGIALVQEPATARHPDMPLNSIAADHVDMVVSPSEIATELARLGHLYAQPELRALEIGKLPADPELFTRIFRMLRGIAGIEFGLYKAGTVHRRISRRMLVTQTASVSDYLQLLLEKPEELRLLHEDLLVGLSWFFRDPEMYDLLKTRVFPSLIEGRPAQQQIRVWVAGCSTGEEVYSIAISLLEYTSTHNLEPAIQIFGTDVSDRAIEKARSGTYPASIMNEISPERMRRFFVPVDKGFQVSKRVRDLCVFARQNLCSDPPFSRIDLLTCRNVLIYLGHQLQRRVIPAFHYALKPHGFLVLGKSEALRDFAEIFEPIDRKNKIFAKLDAGHLSFELPRYVSAPASADTLAIVPQAPTTWSHLELQHAADRTVLATYGPPGLVLNSQFEILQSRGQMAPYLELAPGSASFHLLRILKSSIAYTVRDAVQQAIDNDVPVHIEKVILAGSKEDREFELEVFPIQILPSQERCFLVLFVGNHEAQFRRVPELAAQELVPDGDDQDTLISHLRQDLNANRLYLQSLVEERDLKNHELISSNEEVQSANEELQSTNEELETTKEELQSANEELQTLNDELQQRNVVLTDATNDLTNLLNSVNIPVLMLNNELQIRQFTPLAQKLFSVRTSDIGRPITEIRTNFSAQNLEPVIQEVLDTLSTREMDVQDKNGCWYILRIRPYRTSENRIEGVVLVLLEIDQLRKGQLELQQARDFASDIIGAIQVPLVVLDSNLTIRSANSAFRALSGLTNEDLQARYFPDIVLREWGLTAMKEVLERIGGLAGDAGYYEGEFQGPSEGSILFVRARSVQADRSWVLLLTIEDITARKKAELVIQRENQLLVGQVRSTSQALGQSQGELRALTARLFTTQEEERQRVARELHDDVGQQLALVQMDLEQAQQRQTSHPESLNGQLQNVLSRVASLSDDVRNLSHRLHPSILDDLGLGFALKSLVEEFGERERMPATLTRLNVPEHLAKPVAAALYRITQEALRNVSKHAGKTHVRVVFEGNDAGVTLKIIDMGEGFDQEANVNGLGLLSMAERAHLVGGTFNIQSELGRGTTITVSVPTRSM